MLSILCPRPLEQISVSGGLLISDKWIHTLLMVLMAYNGPMCYFSQGLSKHNMGLTLSSPGSNHRVNSRLGPSPMESCWGYSSSSGSLVEGGPGLMCTLNQRRVKSSAHKAGNDWWPVTSCTRGCRLFVVGSRATTHPEWSSVLCFLILPPSSL